MTLITEQYRDQNVRLHTGNTDYGTSGSDWAAYVEHLILDEGHKTVLDYGCGKGTLRASLEDRGLFCAEYDPAIEGKDGEPEPADLVVLTDVLEHVEPECIDDVLEHVAKLTKRRLVFDVSIVPAMKSLPDGRNVHLMLKSWEWWQAKISEKFDITYTGNRNPYTMFFGEAVPKGCTPPDVPKRIRMTPEVSVMFEKIRKSTRVYADALNHIDTIRLWDGVHERQADMQAVLDILDRVDDPAEMLEKVVRNARKTVLIRVALSPERDKDWWLKLFEGRLRVSDHYGSDKELVAVGTPKIGIQGVTIVGAMSNNERWEHIKSACRRIKKRIEPTGAHKRKAILACYGPSLRETIPLLKEMAEDADADVISVSGSHDFLLAHGVVPAVHVECDPRIHKADNLEKPHPDVRYLIGSCVHPAYFDKLADADVALWHVAAEDHIKRFMSELLEPTNIAISGGSSVGLRALSLLYSLGYREFHVFGMDCSFADGGRQQWAGKHAGKSQEVIKSICGARKFHTSLVLLGYATQMLELIQRSPPETDYLFYGDGMLQAMVAEHAIMAQDAVA